ncbi:hypothetical conserved protein [Rhizobium etli CFN 42]|uniref:Hypothetical conserved protein n=2 Tax=Rhizobium etli TaxID=29449 RepID=Q2K7A5_RHIEC|nr:hypothetical conserved protein [Rhizobium etli CFN 42]
MTVGTKQMRSETTKFDTDMRLTIHISAALTQHISVNPGFQSRKRHASMWSMNLLKALHRLFLLVTMLAVILGPASIGLAGSAMASFSPAMTGDMNSMAGMKMAEEMPCCPEKRPVKPDCAKGCPLSLVCTTSIFAHVSGGHGWSFAVSWRSHRYDLMHPSQLTSAFVDPPARPPKA